MDYIVQIIRLVKRAEQEIQQTNVAQTKRLLQLILKFERKELLAIKKETGSTELYLECKQLQVLAQEALLDVEKGSFEKVLVLLERIKALESHELLQKVKTYHRLKKELDKRDVHIDRIGDALGHGVDPLIKPLVATLSYFGFKTEQSCQGHADHGNPYPWVRIKESSQLKKLVSVIRSYNEQNVINWYFERLVGSSSFMSTVGITKKDRSEFSKHEIDYVGQICKHLVGENGFALEIGTQDVWAVVLFPHQGKIHHDDIRKVFPLVKKALHRKGFSFHLTMPSQSGERDSLNLFPKGVSLEAMQQDIIHLADFITQHFK